MISREPMMPSLTNQTLTQLLNANKQYLAPELDSTFLKIYSHAGVYYLQSSTIMFNLIFFITIY